MIKTCKRIAPGSLAILYNDKIKIKTPTGPYLLIYQKAFFLYPYDTGLTTPNLCNVARIASYSKDLENLKYVCLFLEKFKKDIEFFQNGLTYSK